MALSGFDKSYYLNAKLQALQASEPGWAGKDPVYLDVLLNNVYGLTAEQHYMMAGYFEGLSPNAYFNHDEYRYAKARDMVNSGEAASTDDALAAFSAAWTQDAYQHYVQFGAAEGINPSNSFDESQYLGSKLAALKAYASTAGTWADKSIDDLRSALSLAGMTVVEHYLVYGRNEGLIPTTVPPGEAVTIPGTGGGGETGSDFDLTVGSDIFTGGSEDNTFNGPTTNGLQTLNGGDILDGGTGSDTLFAQLTNISMVVPTITNIETFQFNVTYSGGAVYSAANTSGVTKIENIQSSTPLSVFNLKEVLSSGLVISNSTANVSIGFEDSVLEGDSDTISMTLDGVTGDTTLLLGHESDPNGGIEFLTISSTGAPTDLGTGLIDMAGVTSVTVYAHAALDLGSSDAFENLTVFNASNSTAGVTAQFANKPLADTSVLLTGGQGDDLFDVTSFDENVDLFVNMGGGNDRVSFLKDNLQSGWDIDGGAGINTLQFDQGVDLSNSYINFQAVSFTGTSLVTQNMADLPDTITQVFIDVGDNQSVTITNLDNGDTVTLQKDQTIDDGSTITLQGTGGINTINLILDDGDKQGVDIDDPDGGVVIDSNIQKIVLIPVSNQTHSLDLNESSSLSEIEISGSGSVDLRGQADDVPLNAITTQVNAAGLSGTLAVLASDSDTIIAGGSKGDTITGGSGDDTLTGNAGDDVLGGGSGTNTLTGNAGADVFTIGGTDSIVYVETTDGTSVKTLTSIITDADDLAASKADDINSFTSGTDKIHIAGNLQSLINNYGTNDNLDIALSAPGNTFNYDAATVFLITADVGTAEMGDISQISTLFNDTLTAEKSGALPGQEILFTMENAVSETGIYYFKDVDGNSEISTVDEISLLGIVDAQLTAGDFSFG